MKCWEVVQVEMSGGQFEVRAGLELRRASVKS